MSEISKVIASEIADFFAGFGGPGEPDIHSGEAQRLLTERLLSVLALRERAEPVAWVPQYQLDLLKKSVIVEADLSSMQRFDEVPLYTAPPAPAHVDEIAAQAGIDPAIADAYMQGCHDTGARLSEASGKQPLSVDVLAGAMRNAPLAPSDNQGRQRDLESPAPHAPGNHWYLVSWCGPRGRFGCTEVSFDNPWVLGSMRDVQKIVAHANDLDSRTLVILSVFPIAATPGKEG
ncbi:hypothetical protein ACU9CR_003755 [Cronobacter dublinensis]